MRTNCKLVALAAAFLMLVAPAFGARARFESQNSIIGITLPDRLITPYPQRGIMVSGTPLVGDTARTQPDGIILA